jgi:hypothetical protein
MKSTIIFLCGLLAASPAPAATLDQLAERYVRLALEVGEHDPDYVDAYIGPAAWRDAARRDPRSPAQLAAATAGLLAEVQAMSPPGDEGLARRQDNLLKITRAMDTRIRMAAGERFDFAEEARLIYDVTLPEYSFGEFDRVLAEIEALLPGPGDLATRVDAFYESVNIPEDKVAAVLETALIECRMRTAAHIDLPEDERYTLEFVTGQNWGGYNWYQGDNHSLVQVNLDFPVKIDRAVGLGCHEGYPGHHVWNVLVENRLLKENGWIENSVFPLFSPGGLIGEGSANYGVDLAFPGDERIAYEREVLFPLAGLDPSGAETLRRLNELTRKLGYATTATAQLYLDDRISRDEAVEQRRKYGLTSREKAEQSVRFIEQYRSYVLNYSLGKNIVKAYIERQASDLPGRWAAFERMLVEMPSASMMGATPPTE